jgi:glucose-6-phosphate isomerase
VLPIRLDHTYAMSTAVGEHGLSEAEISALAEPSARALAAVQARRTKDLRWLDLPHRDAVRKTILDYAASVRGRFENVCVLGIGGSALGNTALHTALNGPFHDLFPPQGRPRLLVLDNIDPELIAPFLESVDPTRTVFNVISKSGTTAETMSQFLVLRAELVRRLGEKAHRDHIVITTDESKGVLRTIVARDGYRSFGVPDGVGGRFSVLSEVGLVSSALIGIDVEALHAGAAAMDQRCRAPDLLENPALLHAALQFLLHTRRALPMAVTFAYSHRLRNVADWYAQLLAESLGKKHSRSGAVVHRGPTPIRAVGVTDQHSQVQLYAEGPFDKWFTFLAVDEPEKDTPIPHAYPDLEGVAYLGGRSLKELFQAEREGTRIALTEAGRPCAVVALPRVQAHTVGQLLYLLELSVAVMGEHYDVDAFDQPGVEAGKIAAYALMGRKGYEKRRAEIERGQGAAPARRAP